MKQLPIIKKAALALAAAGMLASASAQADSLVLDQDVNSLIGFTVDVVGANTTTHAIDTGFFTAANQNTGNSFVAFCYELLQGVSVGTLTSPGLEFTAGSTVPAAVQTLFDQSFSLIHLNNAIEVAGFQIALWEALDDGNLYSGTLQNWTGATSSADETEALDNAWVFLEALRANDPTTGKYTLTTWSNADSQDLIQATPGGTVPEPATLALGALGLASLSVVRRRKS